MFGLEFDWAGIALVAVAPIVGSFLGVLIERLPAHRAFAFGRSHCDRCNAVLGPGELVPILSYLALRGRCRHCGQPIASFYPAVELAAVAVAVSAAAFSSPEALYWNVALGWLLLTLAWIDARTRLLPDRLTLPLIALGVAQAWFLTADLTDALIGAACGYGFLWVLEIAYRWARRRPGIGLGDAKLLAAAGAWLGWENLPVTVLVASVSALVLVGCQMLAGRSVDRHTAIAFGPFLAVGIWLVRLFDPGRLLG